MPVSALMLVIVGFTLYKVFSPRKQAQKQDRMAEAVQL